MTARNGVTAISCIPEFGHLGLPFDLLRCTEIFHYWLRAIVVKAHIKQNKAIKKNPEGFLKSQFATYVALDNKHFWLCRILTRSDILTGIKMSIIVAHN